MKGACESEGTSSDRFEIEVEDVDGVADLSHVLLSDSNGEVRCLHFHDF